MKSNQTSPATSPPLSRRRVRETFSRACDKVNRFVFSRFYILSAVAALALSILPSQLAYAGTNTWTNDAWAGFDPCFGDAPSIAAAIACVNSHNFGADDCNSAALQSGPTQ